MSEIPDAPQTQTEPEFQEPPPKSASTTGTLGLDLTPIFLFIAVGLMVGRIVYQRTSDVGMNDGSRWNTVYYLLEHGTYEYKRDHGARWGHHRDRIEKLRSRGKIKPGEKLPPRFIPPFETCDMIAIEVKKSEGEAGQATKPAVTKPATTLPAATRPAETEKEYKYYSSKPPLLPTTIAGVVWLVQKVTGTTFRQNPWLIIRITLILVQVIPFVICFLLIRSHIYRFTDCVFVRNFCVAGAALATYLTPWSIVLNNHVIGAFSAMFALHAAIRIWYDGRREWYYFVIAGIFAGFTAAVELPAALFALLILAVLIVKDYKRALIFGLAFALLPIVVGLFTNYLAIGTVKPAYIQANKPGGYYYYPGSYWNAPTGTDALGDWKPAEPRWFYLMNMMVGHHGMFSLTPILIFSLIGLLLHFRRQERANLLLAFLVLALTAAMAAVYTIKTSNYGGTSQG
ncbi:MAG: hypothetical protein ACYTF1_16315 [Planctomycetota bacterium]|jgi:hypothetical protein